MREHWIKYQQTQIGGQFPEKQIALAQMFHVILFLTLAHVLASLFYSNVTLTSAVGGKNKQPCFVPCSTTVHMRDRWAMCFQLLGSRGIKRGWSMMFSQLLFWDQSSSPLDFLPSQPFFPLLSWCWGLNPVSCAYQSCALPLSYTRSRSSTLLCDVFIFVFLGRFSRSPG